MERNLNLPNLLIVGAAKSGTTSLHNYLMQHPKIFMSQHKEPHFLINQEIGINRIHKAVLDINDYKNLFANTSSFKYRGESSVMYLPFFNISIKNIRKYLDKSVKIIIMLRNPVDRAYAGYLHNLRYNPSENFSFEEALERSEDRYHSDLYMSPDTRYLYVGKYFSQVNSFLEEFEDNVHVILYDDYASDINLCLQNIFDFLEIEKINIDTSKRHMQGGWIFRSSFARNIIIPKNKYKSFIKKVIPFQNFRSKIKQNVLNLLSVKTKEMSPEIRKKLIKYYREDILKLSKVLNTNLDNWLR